VGGRGSLPKERRGSGGRYTHGQGKADHRTSGGGKRGKERDSRKKDVLKQGLESRQKGKPQGPLKSVGGVGAGIDKRSPVKELADIGDGAKKI